MASLCARSLGVFPLAGLLLVGCGDDSSRPGVDTDTDTDGSATSVDSTGSTTMAASSSTGEPSTTADPATSSTTGVADTSTGPAVDEPPTVTLTVAGQARPAALTGADLVPLEAEAGDDSAVDRVEFFRDGELVATDDEAPYTAEVLLTSLDNASIDFHAVAYDDADQSTDSEVVPLSVEVIGANIVHVATDVLAAGGLAYAPGGGVQLGEDGTVYVATSTLDETENAFGLRAAQVSADLSTVNWEVRVPQDVVMDGDQILVTGEPLLVEDADRLLIAGTGFISGSSGTFEATVVSVALDGSSATVPYNEVGADDQTFNIPGLVAGPPNDIILHGPGDTLSRISAGVPVWQVPTVSWDVSDLGATHMSSDAGGDILLDALSCGADPCTWTVHKIAAADGAEIWQNSLPVDVDLSDFHVGASVTAPNGDVVLAYGQSADAGGDIQLVRWDADGNPLETVGVDSGAASLTVSDVEFDAQGQLVILGSRIEKDGADANLLRVSPEGGVLWSRSFGFGTERDLSLAFALDARGRVVVSGLADPQVGFLVFGASLWLATVDL
ncbi:MAG: Ig-like domain-containing protein [Nannocystales bacterium]